MKKYDSLNAEMIANYRASAKKRRSISKLKTAAATQNDPQISNAGGKVIVSLSNTKPLSSFRDPQRILGRSKIAIPEFRLHRK